MKNYFHEEEDFHGKDRKQFRKERKHAQETDRSKFKKSDQDQIASAVPSTDPRLRRGRVLAITGQGVWTDVDGVEFLCSLKGLMKKEKGRSKNLIAVGDLVAVLPSSPHQQCDTGAPSSGPQEGSIVYIEERTSTLSRIDVSGRNEQLIAVNIDQVLIIASVVNPPLKPSLIDRYLIAAEKGRMHPIIIINKIDLLDGEETLYRDFLYAYEKLGIPILSVSTLNHTGIEELRALLQNKASVFAGQSGVGKSSLLNVALHLELKTGPLTKEMKKGVHTTSMAELLPLPGGGFCIDTPGIRSFGIFALNREDLVHHYSEFQQYAESCRYPDCTHLVEPSCGVQKAKEAGLISTLRFESYRTLMEEIGGRDNRTKQKDFS